MRNAVQDVLRARVEADGWVAVCASTGLTRSMLAKVIRGERGLAPSRLLDVVTAVGPDNVDLWATLARMPESSRLTAAERSS